MTRGGDPFARWWDAHHPGVAPLGYVLREARPERWLRVHSLPEPKRYPDTDDEWATLLSRQRTVAAEVLGADAPVWVVVADSYLDEHGALAALPHLAPALEMSVDGMEDSGAWTFHAAEARWDFARFEPALRAIANDELRVLFVGVESGRVFAPYDGGVDLIVETVAERDRVRARFGAWLSREQGGL